MHGRLRYARKKAGYSSAQKAAEDNNWTVSAYRAHENGQNKFDYVQASDYGAAYGVKAPWLMTGEGPRTVEEAWNEERKTTRDPKYDDALDAVALPAGSTTAGEEILAAALFDVLDADPGLITLTPTLKGILQKIAPNQTKALIKRSAEASLRNRPIISGFDPDEVEPEDPEPRMVEGTMGQDVGALPKDAILLADVSLGMGPGGVTHITELMAPDGNTYGAEGIKDWVRLPADVVRGRFRVPANRIRCFEAVGDSMEPKVHDGDIVFVDVGHRVPSPPGIYALADALGGVILKRLSISAARGQDPVMVDLISDNPKIPPERRTLDEITITGRYLGRLTTE